MLHSRALGIILAGGRATRLGGRDKALLDLAGEPLIARVAGRLRAQVAKLAVSANGDAARFSFLGLPVLGDSEPDFPGPLAGVLAALDWAAAVAPGHALLSVSVDCPFLPPDLAGRLHAAAAGSDRVAVASSAGRPHPVVALWPPAVRERLRTGLRDGSARRVGQFIASIGQVVVEWPAEPIDPFLNINTPQDLAVAEEALRQAWAR